METEKESQRLAEAKNAQLEAETRRLKLEVERKCQLRIEQQRNLEIAAENVAAEARIAEAERRRKEVEKEVKEKEKQKAIWAAKITPTPTITKVGLKRDSSEESDIEPKSSLNRSHSSPNIAQMFDDDNVYTNTNVLNKNNINKMSKPVCFFSLAKY